MTENAPWLIIDSGSPRALVGIASSDGVIAQTFMDGHRKHAETLSHAMTECMSAASVTLAQISGVAVGRGPGSFVGVRVGMATAKGLAFAAGKPLLGLCPLFALANGADVPSGRGLAILDARKGEVYFRLIEKNAEKGSVCLADGTLAPAQLEHDYPQIDFIVGNGVDLFSDQFLAQTTVIRKPGPDTHGYRLSLPKHGDFEDELYSLAPHYWRAPDAKKPAASTLSP